MNPQKEDVLAYLHTKKADFSHNLSVTKLGLFGSYALNQQTENSDIDLLIEFAPNTDALTEKKAEIVKAVQAEFGKEVDLD